MITGMCYLMGLLWLGEALVDLLGLPIPGNILGMVLLTVCLRLGWIKTEDVEDAAQALVKNLAFLFVPPGVGLMLYGDLVAENWLPLGAGFFLSSFAVLFVVGRLQQALEPRP
ncbi:MAG: CidA/LrgA family protein [Deltaproteobacteria bacterium]|nr:CidA/LrgA family protein [Deltaproteobacteria bacterium]